MANARSISIRQSNLATCVSMIFAKFNLVVSSAEETFSFFGDIFLFGQDHAERSWSYADENAKDVDTHT